MYPNRLQQHFPVTLAWEARHYPFGELTSECTNAINDLRFPGQIHDRETDLRYNWHRYYDPTIGRYLQPDPIGSAGRDEFVWVRWGILRGGLTRWD